MTPDKRKAKQCRLRRRMRAIEEQARREREARQPAPESKPPTKEPEIIDVPGLVRAPAPGLPDNHPLRILARMAPLWMGHRP